MPYIHEDARSTWDHYLRPLLVQLGENTHPGVVNYIITRIVLAALGRVPSYERLNALVGALECAKLELYRRAVAPYEDKKIAENGDVYP